MVVSRDELRVSMLFLQKIYELAADGTEVSKLSLPSLDASFGDVVYAVNGSSLSFNITLTEKTNGNPNARLLLQSGNGGGQAKKFESMVLVNHLGTDEQESLSFKFDVIVNGY